MTAPDSGQTVRAATSCRPYRVLRVSGQRLYAGIESAWRWCRTHESYVGVCGRTACGKRYHAQRMRPGYCSSPCRQSAYRARLLRFVCVRGKGFARGYYIRGIDNYRSTHLV